MTNAVDIKTGVFTAPVDGIYHFYLSGINENSKQPVWIKLRLNTEMIGSAYANIPQAIFSLQSVLRMKRGDRVELFLEEGAFYDDTNHFTHFMGFRIINNCLNCTNNASPVYFYVQRNSSYSTEESRIPFHLARLNEGGAMNLTTGIFTAPRDGVYRFSLIGIKDHC